MKSTWPLVWIVVGVIMLGETVTLWRSGRLAALLPHGNDATDQAPVPALPQALAQAPAGGTANGQQELPVHVVTPPTRGAVLPLLQNAGAQPMTLRVTVRRPGTDQRHEWEIALGPNQTLPIAGRGGWTFAAGDELELFHEGYRTRNVPLQ